MGFQVLKCPDCGAQKLEKNGEEYFCKYCGCKCTDDGAQRAYERLVANIDERFGSALDEYLKKEKEDRFYALRANLWEKIHDKYIDSRAIVEICRDIKNIAPRDFIATFYEVANGGSMKALVKFVNKIDVKEQELYIERVLEFLLKSLTSELIAPVNYLIERAYKNTDLRKFEAYVSRLEEEAVKVEGGIYDTGIPRDVFIAYASEDIDVVLELAEYLEENDLSCFVAMRNLQHGIGAVDNYEKEIQNAIDNCKTVVFVSSEHSRRIKRDALRIELPYIKKKDLENAPAGYRLNYVTMPSQYKKPRVEYRLDNVPTGAADIVLREFFGGLDYCESPEKVMDRVVRYLTEGMGSMMPVETIIHPVEEPSVTEKTVTLPPKTVQTEQKTENAATPKQENNLAAKPAPVEEKPETQKAKVSSKNVDSAGGVIALFLLIAIAVGAVEMNYVTRNMGGWEIFLFGVLAPVIPVLLCKILLGKKLKACTKEECGEISTLGVGLGMFASIISVVVDCFFIHSTRFVILKILISLGINLVTAIIFLIIFMSMERKDS